MIPVTHVFEWADIAPNVRKELFMEFAAAGAEHLVLTTSLINLCMQKNANAIALQQEIQAAGMDFVDAHAMFGIWEDLCLPVQELRPMMLNRHKFAIQTCRFMNVDTICIHVGNGHASYGELNTLPILADNIRRSLDELLPVAEKYKVVICIENIWSPLNTPEQLLSHIEAFKSPYLGICYDAGHANISTCQREKPNAAENFWGIFNLPVQWDDHILEKLQPHIVNCHLHDNNGIVDEHLLPGLGNIDWKHVMTLLKAAPRIKCIQNETLSKTLQYSLADRVKAFDRLMTL